MPVRQLFNGDTINPQDIKLRAIRPEEAKEYETRKAEFLPAVPEIEHVREQIRHADWVVIPYDFVSHFSRWPEFADELRDRHFVFVKEYPLYILLRRTPAN